VSIKSTSGAWIILYSKVGLVEWFAMAGGTAGRGIL